MQLIPSLVTQAVRGSVIVRSGATRDLLDVDDLISITAGLLQVGPATTPMNIASGASTPVTQLVSQINKVLER